jgi:hypothetical protein
MKLSRQVILSTRQDSIAGLGASVWPPDRKDLVSDTKSRLFAKAQNDNTLCTL